MRTQKPIMVIVSLTALLTVPASKADVVQQEVALKEDLSNLLKGAPSPLKYATVENVTVAAEIEPATD